MTNIAKYNNTGAVIDSRVIWAVMGPWPKAIADPLFGLIEWYMKFHIDHRIDYLRSDIKKDLI